MIEQRARELLAALDQPFRYPGEIGKAVEALRVELAAPHLRDFPAVKEAGRAASSQLGFYKRMMEPQQAGQTPPVLVRDLAEVIGSDVPTVCKALSSLGFPERSTNMAVGGEEALAVAAHLKKAQQAAQGGEPISNVERTAPARIWLNVFTDEPLDSAEFPANHEGITWAEDEVGDADVAYIRADLVGGCQMSARCPAAHLCDCQEAGQPCARAASQGGNGGGA